MVNALGLTVFESIEFVTGWNFVALNIFATRFWASLWFKANDGDISEETILAMRYMGVFLAWGRAFQYLCHSGKDKDLKYKGYLMSSAVWIASASLIVLHRDIIDPIQVYINLPFYSAMGVGFFFLAPSIRKEAVDGKQE